MVLIIIYSDVIIVNGVIDYDTVKNLVKFYELNLYCQIRVLKEKLDASEDCTKSEE